jgi:hypothetical protein
MNSRAGSCVWVGRPYRFTKAFSYPYIFTMGEQARYDKLFLSMCGTATAFGSLEG